MSCPWFDTPCVHYSYVVEREETESYTDSQGKRRTRTHWTTEHSQTRTIPFELDGGATITVQGPDAEFHDLQGTGNDYERSDLRHRADLLAIGSDVSVLGVCLDDGTFGPMQEVPLVVTPRTREAFIRSVQAAERWLRRFGFLSLFLGGGAAVLVYAGGVDARAAMLAVLAGCLTILPAWLISIYNRFVRLRQQVETSWRQVDVDLSVRKNLVPHLVAVIEGYREHEAELLESLTRIRAGGSAEEQIGVEGHAVSASRQVFALAEKYPELRANDLFLDLHDRLWALEEKLASSRGLFNGFTKEWNDLIEAFPSVLAARMLGHRTRPFFRLDPGTSTRAQTE